jgi:hypothetical protein
MVRIVMALASTVSAMTALGAQSAKNELIRAQDSSNVEGRASYLGNVG